MVIYKSLAVVLVHLQVKLLLNEHPVQRSSDPLSRISIIRRPPSDIIQLILLLNEYRVQQSDSLLGYYYNYLDYFVKYCKLITFCEILKEFSDAIYRHTLFNKVWDRLPEPQLTSG